MAEKYNNKYRIQSARLANWDYRWDASYFVTICTKNRVPYFGKIRNDVMNLSDEGKFAEECWLQIPNHFSFIILHAFVVMPNHVHGILVIDHKNGNNAVETLHCNVSTGIDNKIDNDDSNNEKNKFMASISPKPGSISTIIRSYKSAVSKQAHDINPDFGWQSRFHDHIIRNEESFIRIQHYILNNVKNWKEDKFFE